MSRAALALAVVLAAGAARADVDPDAPAVRVLVMKDGVPAREPQVRVGEPFHVLVSAAARPNVVVTLPASFETGKLEVVERREVLPEAGAGERSFDLTVVAWEPGKQTLPPIPLSYVAPGQSELRTLHTEPVSIEVLAVLGAEQGELRPIAPPVPVYERDWTLVTVAGAAAGALLLGSGLWLGWRAARRRRRAEQAAEPVVDRRPAHEIALEKLRALESMLGSSDRRPFYFAVTEVLREFLGRRFGFGALDMTSSEVLVALAASPQVAAPYRDRIERWLGACDLVKFARVEASHDEAAEVLQGAVALVDDGRPPPEPVRG